MPFFRRFPNFKKFKKFYSTQKLSANLNDYDVFINPSARLLDIFMNENGRHRPDFKLSDISTWQNSWGDDYRFGLIFRKQTDQLVFSFHTVQYKSLGFQPDFQHVGMAWIPEKCRGREVLSVVTKHFVDVERMKERNTLACNVVWSQNFWRKAMGNGDIGSCTFYISHYDLQDFKVPGIEEPGVFVEKITENTINDALLYDKSVFPFSRDNWMRQLFHEGIARIAYNSSGKPIGIGCVSVYPSGECVISPLYADNKRVAQLIFQSILEEILEKERRKTVWRMQVRSNDQCRDSFEL